MISKPKYEMTLSLNVLKHLGFGLYSNIAAVLSEVVANAWDADAQNVSISIDAQNDCVTIEDDGHGMTVEDANQKYLTVGYERREPSRDNRTPGLKRKVMGRKGIGKLSLFSIARTVEVHSVKDGDKHGFVMDSDSDLYTQISDYYRAAEQVLSGRTLSVNATEGSVNALPPPFTAKRGGRAGLRRPAPRAVG